MAVTTLPTGGGTAMSPRPPARHGPVGPALLSFAKCFGARDNHEIYLSTPITTGQAYIAWRHSNGADITVDHPRYESLHYEHVISANISRVGPLVARLRDRFSGRFVIDPTSLDDISGWAQSDYHEFWCALIEKYVALIVFADGWQFSTGCVYEFATALRLGKETLTERLQPLSPREGLSMIFDAADEFDSLQVNAENLRNALKAAKQAAQGQ